MEKIYSIVDDNSSNSITNAIRSFYTLKKRIVIEFCFVFPVNVLIFLAA